MSVSTNSSPPTLRPGYATPAASHRVPPMRHTSHIRLAVILGISLAVVITVAFVVAWLLTPAAAVHHCRRPDCGHPPTKPPVGPIEPVPAAPLPIPPFAKVQIPAALPNTTSPPVQSNPRFTGPDGSWSVAYPAKLAPAPPGSSVGWTFTRDGSRVLLFGLPAGDLAASDIAQRLISKACPGATVAYEIPNAMVGYQHGYGVIEDFFPQSGAAQFTRGRVLAIVAIKNGVALGVLAVGPYDTFIPPAPDDHPSGADLDVAAADLGQYVNSFMWRGDPPR
jgi:hypothetical protein